MFSRRNAGLYVLLILLLIPAILLAAISSSTFTGSENPLSEGALWSNPATNTFVAVKKVSGEARSTAIVSDSAAMYATAIGNDQCSEVTVSAYTSSAGNAVHLFVRIAGTTDLTGYWAVFNNGTSFFLEGQGTMTITTPSGGTNITATTLTAGDVVRLCVVGTAISLYRNGTIVNSTSDASVASGKTGFGMAYATPSVEADVSISDWRGGLNADFLSTTVPNAMLLRGTTN